MNHDQTNVVSYESLGSRCVFSLVRLTPLHNSNNSNNMKQQQQLCYSQTTPKIYTKHIINTTASHTLANTVKTVKLLG